MISVFGVGSHGHGSRAGVETAWSLISMFPLVLPAVSTYTQRHLEAVSEVLRHEGVHNWVDAAVNGGEINSYDFNLIAHIEFYELSYTWQLYGYIIIMILFCIWYGRTYERDTTRIVRKLVQKDR